MKLHDYRQTIAYMKRRGFANGTPPPKPQRTFNEKIETFSEAAPFIMPRSGVAILKGYLDDALKDGEITQEEHTQALMPLFGETGEMITEQIEKSDRENFYAGSSLEQFGLQIKESYLAGKSIPKINEELGFKNDRTSTIDSFIKSMQSGEAPITITEEEFSARPVVKQGRGQAGEAQKRLKTFIETFEKENNRLPSSQELRRLGNFDFYTIKNAVDTGNVEILDSTTAARMAQQESQGVNKQLLELSKDKDINNIFKSGKTTIGDIKKVKKVIGNVSDSVAADRLLQLASIYAETGIEDNRGLNIKPKFKDNAAKILKSSPYTGYIRNMNEALIGKSVGDPSIKGTKNQITESPDYKQTGISKTYDIDEPLGVSSSVNRGSTPYGIYGQIIDASKNKMKVGWDSRKSQLELELQEAIQSKDKKQIDDAVKKFNNEARAAEKLFNKDRRRGSKKIVIPEVSLDKPSKTNANYKNLNDNYKKAFDAVHANQGYSFKIPADLKPITQIKKDLKDPKILSKVKKAAELGDNRLYARIPVLTELFETAASIPDDLKRAKYLSAGLKTLGVAATPLIAYDTYKAFESGVPALEALEQGFIGTNIIGGMKDYSNLSEEAKEARNIFEQKKRTRQLSDQVLGISGEPDQDVARRRMLQTNLPSETFDAETLNMQSEISEQEAKKIYDQDKKRVAAERKAMESEIANARKIAITDVFDFMTGKRFQPQPIPQEFMATGGRVGFADGPDDPSKRKFIKIGAGLMSLPFVGKYFKAAAPIAGKTVEVIKRGSDGIPDFIGDLITKVITLGKKSFSGNRADELEEVFQLDNYVVTKQGSKTRVKKVDDQGEFGYKEHEMELEYDPESGGYTYNEGTIRPDAEGKLKDIEEFIDDTDLEDMKKYTYDE